MLVSNCTICGKKKSGFIKNEKADRLLSKLEIRNNKIIN